MGRLQRVWHSSRERLLLRTPASVPFWICKCSFVETTDTQSYITSPIHDTFPDFTYRIWLLCLIWHYQFMTLSLICLLTEFDITEYRFPCDICSKCGMQTGDAYPSGHLVPSLFLEIAYAPLLRPVFPNLPCLISICHFEYPTETPRVCSILTWNLSSLFVVDMYPIIRIMFILYDINHFTLTWPKFCFTYFISIMIIFIENSL